MAETKTDEQAVGHQFVRVYFKTLFKDPKTLISLYKEESTFTRGEGAEVVTYKGLQEISTALESLQANCIVDVRNVVVQSSFESSFIVTVTGLFLDTVADTQRAFTQVFLLHPQQPKGLFVLNEVFLYADHEQDSNEERDVLDVGEPAQEDAKDEPETEPAAAAAADDEEQVEKALNEPEPEAAEPETEKKEAKPDSIPQEVAGVPQEVVEKVVKAEATKVPTEEVKKPFSWDTVHKNGPKKLVASPQKSGPAVAPAQKPPVERSAAGKSPASAGGKLAESRFVEVSNFDPSVNKDILKKAMAPYGAVKYISFQGQHRATVEFDDIQGATKVLMSRKPVKVGEKTVRVVPGSAPPPRGSNAGRGKRDGAPSGRGRGGRGGRGGGEGRPSYRNSPART